jgi:hypothetical protein
MYKSRLAESIFRPLFKPRHRNYATSFDFFTHMSDQATAPKFNKPTPPGEKPVPSPKAKREDGNSPAPVPLAKSSAVPSLTDKPAPMLGKSPAPVIPNKNLVAGPKVQKKVAMTVRSKEQAEGVGATVHRSIGTYELRNLDPFLMLDEFDVNSKGGFPDQYLSY